MEVLVTDGIRGSGQVAFSSQERNFSFRSSFPQSTQVWNGRAIAPGLLESLGEALPHPEELHSLAMERSPEMFYGGLLNLGMRLEAENRFEAAAAVYSAFASAPASIRDRANQRLGAIQGVGPSGVRAEFLLRRLAREALEPTTLFGLGVASSAFRLARLATLGRLLGSPTGHFLTRGFGAQAAAGLAGFGVEATVFPLATRLGGLALGRDLDWNSGQVGGEIASSFIVLGALKLTGAMVQPLGSIGGVGARSAAHYWRMPLRQIGMFGGILLGHRLEEAVGIRPHLDGGTTCIDSLAILLQFNIAGNFTQRASGLRFRIWERELDFQGRVLAEVGAKPQELALFPSMVMMSAGGDGKSWIRRWGGRLLPPQAPPRPTEPALQVPELASAEIAPVLKHAFTLSQAHPPSDRSFHPEIFQIGQRVTEEFLRNPETRPELMEALLRIEEDRYAGVAVPDFLFAVGLHAKETRNPFEAVDTVRRRLGPDASVLSFFRGINREEVKVWEIAEQILSRKSNEEKITALRGIQDQVERFPDLKLALGQILGRMGGEPKDSIRVSQDMLNILLDQFRNASMTHMFFSESPQGDALKFARMYGAMLQIDLPLAIFQRMPREGLNHVAFNKNAFNLLHLARAFDPDRLYIGRESIEARVRPSEENPASTEQTRAARVDPQYPLYFPQGLIDLIETARRHPSSNHMLQQISLQRATAQLDRRVRAGELEVLERIPLERLKSPEAALAFLKKVSEAGLDAALSSL